MLWEGFLTTIFSLYQSAVSMIGPIFKFFDTKLSDLIGEDAVEILQWIAELMPWWTGNIFGDLFSDLLDTNIAGIMFGTALITFLIVTVVKWIIGIVT